MRKFTYNPPHIYTDEASYTEAMIRYGVPTRYAAKYLDHVKPRNAAQERAFEQAEALVENWQPKAQRRVEPRGLLLWGNPGSGKTLIAALTFKAVLLDRGQRGRFMTYAQVIGLYHDEMRYAQMGQEAEWKVAHDEKRALLNDYDLLVLDDVGKEHHGASGFAATEYNNLIRNRYDRGLVTLVSSNYSPDQWGGAYGDHVASFMQEALVDVPLVGHDQRAR